jgi:hypothetical protein
MHAEPTPSPTPQAPPARYGGALIWLAIFLYLPFLLAHGMDAWRQPAVDFPPLYSATRVVFDEGRSPYGERSFEKQAVALGRWVPPYIYPPPSLLLFYPLHFFSYDGAKALMLIANHLCLLFAIGFTFRKLLREEFARAPGPLATALFLAYALLFDPVVVTVHLGQVNLLLLVTLCLTWDALKRNAGAFAIAIPLSLAIVIKTYPVLLLLLLAFRRRYKAAAVTVALYAVYCAASHLLLPSGIWEDWLTKVLPAGDNAHPGPWNQNIRAFIARTFMPNDFSAPLVALPALVKPAIGVLSLAVFATTIWCSFRRWREPETARGIDLEMSLYLFMIFLIAPGLLGTSFRLPAPLAGADPPHARLRRSARAVALDRRPLALPDRLEAPHLRRVAAQGSVGAVNLGKILPRRRALALPSRDNTAAAPTRLRFGEPEHAARTRDRTRV